MMCLAYTLKKISFVNFIGFSLDNYKKDIYKTCAFFSLTEYKILQLTTAALEIKRPPKSV